MDYLIGVILLFWLFKGIVDVVRFIRNRRNIDAIDEFIWNQKNIEKMLRGLKSKNWEVRARVVRQANTFLEESTDDRKVGILTGALQDQNSYVRMQAAKIFEQKIDAEVGSGEKRRPVISSSIKPFVVKTLVNALEDEYPEVRKFAAGALGKTQGYGVVAPLIKHLEDTEPEVRKSVMFALRNQGEIRAIKPLLKLLEGEDHDAVLTALEPLCRLVRKIVFGDNQVVIFEPEHTLRNPDVSRLTVPMPELKEIVIYTTTCDIQHIEALVKYVSEYIGEERLKKRIELYIYGELGKFPSDFFKVFSACKQVDVDIETVIFANARVPTYDLHRTWQNPDSSEQTLSLSHLKQIVVDSETYNFHLVERFLTYALDYIGQDHLEKEVDVHIYGDPEKLQQNLRNNFTNLCKSITVHEV